MKNLPTMTINGLKLMTHVYCDLSQRRRESIHPESNGGFRVLCSNEYSVTDKLFEDNLGKRVEDITKANKVGSKISDSSNSFPIRKYQSQWSYNPTNRPQLFFRPVLFPGLRKENAHKQQADEDVNHAVLPSENVSEFPSTSKNLRQGKVPVIMKIGKWSWFQVIQKF